MASFVVETYVPQGDPECFASDVDGIRVASEAIVVVDGCVHHVRSYLVRSDEMGFHFLDAETAEDVVRVTEMAGIEVERIVEAIGVGPGRAVDGRTEGGR